MAHCVPWKVRSPPRINCVGHQIPKPPVIAKEELAILPDYPKPGGILIILMQNILFRIGLVWR
jgi:hypothetical protein